MSQEKLMHELSLCESIRTVLETEAEKQAFDAVIRVRLEIGRMSGVEAEAMRFGFDAVMAGSIAESAVLEIVETPGQAWCNMCDMNVPVSARYDPCPQCGSHPLLVTGGTDMKILELEVR